MTALDAGLGDRMSATDGLVTLSGVQALLRVPLDQERADRARGLRTATLISGYRGSPLGGVEGVIARHSAEFAAADVRFISGVNEDLAATMIWGAQMTALENDSAYDGVKGVWYGKGPGLDRSGDAIRHAMFAGVGEHGGVLALAGDDPECKSSTIPSASEAGLADLGLPVLYPSDVGDCLRLGRYGFELSRSTGLWVGVKVHTDVADGFAGVPGDSADIDLVDYVHEVDGRPWRPTVDNRLIAPYSVALEEELFGHRTEAAKGFARANRMDRSWGATDAWLGIVVAGKPLGDVRDALGGLGITDSDLVDFGVRILSPAMISPLEPQSLRAFADGLETIFMVEAKRPFIESQVRDILYGGPNMPAVVGKRGFNGERLLPAAGVMSATVLDGPLRAILQTRIDPDRLARRRERIALLPSTVSDGELPSRTPYYCSGCPHNRSTVVPDQSIVLGGIGCHSMALFMDRGTVGLTQMGGEGAQWVGAAPFLGDRHRFQNLGDGTFFHSGSLALRQAVAAGTNITYKILYNGVVAMTGGQAAAGEIPVPELTRLLDAEGVVRTIVVTDDPAKYPADAQWAETSRVEHRDSFDSVQRELQDVPGVTAIIYDQACAAELRRGRKRGTIETPTTRIMIDEAICEGCGHCGEISNCMSVHPVETPFGRKTRIHQESCNFDYSCVDGNCPAFVTIEIDPEDSVEHAGRPAPIDVAQLAGDGELPDPSVPEEATIVIVGIGGTGVVTVSQVLSTAATLDGRVATSLDQTGLAQKGGQVVSNLHIGEASHVGAAKVGPGDADVLLIFDVVGGSSPGVLARGRSGHTAAYVSTSRVPTGSMVSSVAREHFPEIEAFRQRIDSISDPDASRWIDAESIARHVFGSQPAANMLMLGVAFQRGSLPVSASAIERAIDVNGVAVEVNQAAFDLGRRLAEDDELATRLSDAAATRAEMAPKPTPVVAELIDVVPSPDAELVEILSWRTPELIEWGDRGYATEYVQVIAEVRRAETELGGDRQDLARTAARHLFKLMAYKDEYEVARLATRSKLADQARARFGPNAKVSYQLKPPTLKNAGYDKKISVPEKAARAAFASLAKGRRLRGTRVDPFGRTEERVAERALIGEYKSLIDRLLESLSIENYDRCVGIADMADRIRGFDEIKMANIETYRRAVAGELDRLDRNDA